MDHDVVKSPKHYTEGRRFEPKDVIRDWRLNFNLGSALKYIARAGRKGDIVEESDYRYSKEADGWCDTSVKELLVFNFKQSVESVRDLAEYQRKVIRHEIIHAFLYESGLWQNSLNSGAWAKNEEMVDWLAIQAPKIFMAFREAGVDDFKEGN